MAVAVNLIYIGTNDRQLACFYIENVLLMAINNTPTIIMNNITANQ